MIAHTSELTLHETEIPDSPFPDRERHRRLKIETAGDIYKGGLKPKICLMGLWLERAGFKAGTHVDVTCVAIGILEVRSDSAPSGINGLNSQPVHSHVESSSIAGGAP